MVASALIVLSPALTGPEGHELEYNLGLLDAARSQGARARLLRPRGPLPFDRDEETVFPDWRPRFFSPGGPLTARLQRKIAHLTEDAGRLHVYRRLFDRFDAPEMVFLLHTAPYPEIGLACAAFAATRRQGRLSIVLRFDPGDDIRAHAQLRRAIAPAARAPISLYSDSLDLARQLQPLAPVPIGIVPPPADRLPVTPRSIPRIGYFGAMRRQKGFHRLPRIIEAIAARRPDVQFFVQAYGHGDDRDGEECLAVRNRLEAMPGVEIVDTTMDRASYRAALSNCAVTLLPYDADTYRWGTSGIFVAALAAGSKMVVPAGTWMATETARAGLEAVRVIVDEMPESWAAAALDLLSSTKSSPNTETWVDTHAYDRLASLFLAGSVSVA